MKYDFNKLKKSNNGVIFMASTLGIFILLSFFAFFLARFSATETRSSSYHVMDIKARNLSLLGLEHGMQSLKYSYNALLSSMSGRLNNGQFLTSIDESKYETGLALPYEHFSLLKSKGKISDVERNVRVVVSSYPNAFNLVFFGNNQNTGGVFSSGASIDGDIYFNGDYGALNLASSSRAYSSLSNPSNNGIFHGLPLVSFPDFDRSYYDNLLSSVSGSYGSGGTEPMISFDGSNDYAAIQNLKYTEPGQISKLTVSAWVKVPLNGGDWSIVDFDRSEYYSCIAGIRNTSANGEGDFIGFHTRGVSQGIHDMWSTTSIRDNKWHHIVWVFDSEQLYEKKIYIDGQLDSQVNYYNTNVKLGSGTDRYGFLADGSEANSYNAGRNKIYYQGSMDQVSIWDRAFSASEISSLQNINTNSSGLVAYWPMNEGSGVTLTDAANNNNAIMVNGPTWGTRTTTLSFSGQTINLTGLNQSTLMSESPITFDNCTIIGPGKILSTGSITISGGSQVSGYVNIISEGALIISGSCIVGSSISSGCVLYSESNININGSVIYGLAIGIGGEFTLSNNTNFYGGIYTESYSVNVDASNIIGSLVSKNSLNLTNSSSLSKGSLPPIFGLPYGFKSSVVPGSYLEY